MKYGRKFSNIGHRRFLDSDYKFRKQKQSFDGHVDTRSALITVFGGEIMLQTDAIVDHVFGKKTVNLPNKKNKKKKRGGSLNFVEEEKYIFHLALLEGPCVVSQS